MGALWCAELSMNQEHRDQAALGARTRTLVAVDQAALGARGAVSSPPTKLRSVPGPVPSIASVGPEGLQPGSGNRPSTTICQRHCRSSRDGGTRTRALVLPRPPLRGGARRAAAALHPVNQSERADLNRRSPGPPPCCAGTRARCQASLRSAASSPDQRCASVPGIEPASAP